MQTTTVFWQHCRIKIFEVEFKLNYIIYLLFNYLVSCRISSVSSAYITFGGSSVLNYPCPLNLHPSVFVVPSYFEPHPSNLISTGMKINNMLQPIEDQGLPTDCWLTFTCPRHRSKINQSCIILHYNMYYFHFTLQEPC